MGIRQLLCIGPKYYYEAVLWKPSTSLNNPVPTKLWIINRESAYRVTTE